MSFLDRYFEISARGSTMSREVRGGLATFLKLGIPAVAAVTALVAGVMTILMGVVGRFPLALAAGLGVNAMVAFEIAPKMTWADRGRGHRLRLDQAGPGKPREVPPLLWAVSALFLVYFLRGAIEQITA